VRPALAGSRMLGIPMLIREGLCWEMALGLVHLTFGAMLALLRLRIRQR